MFKKTTFAVLLVAVAAYAALRSIRSGPDIPLGAAAPEIEGKDLDGVPFRLSDYRGKVVVLDFWGFW